MKKSGILVIGFLSVMVVLVGFTIINPQDPPQISDAMITSDSVTINPNPSDDGVIVKDSVTLKTENYWVDEDGKKHYTINVQDVPSIGS